MNVADRLLKRFEANISQSLGVRAGGASPGSVETGPARAPQDVAPGPNEGRTRARSLGHMEIENIIPDPDQPRKEFDEPALRRLSRSLAKYGQLLPIRVRWNDRLDKWVIISGERRYRAALAAGLRTVTCHFVEEELSPARVLEEQVIENCLREGLKPVEQARAYQALMERNAWSARRVAEELHVASSTVTKALALLKLPEDVQAQVEGGVVPATVAYELAKLDGPEAKREAATRIALEELSREEAVALVRAATGGRRKTRVRDKGAGKPADPLPGTTEQENTLVVREVRVGDDRATLEYSLANGFNLTITTGLQTAAGDVVAATSYILEDLRANLATMTDPGLPWAGSPICRRCPQSPGFSPGASKDTR
jgi:ParB family chromosome partitioning protein